MAATDATAVGAILAGAAAVVTAAVSALRGRRDTTRSDLTIVIDSFKSLLAEHRVQTDRQVATLEDDVAELRAAHEECERKLVALEAR